LLETSLSLLTALWRAMKRIAGLMLRRHHAFQIIW